MAEPANSAIKTKHAGKAPKRSRIGCITCKIRRVKCDETRPACNRCISTGRTCDGYPATGAPSQHSTRRALATAVRQLQVVGPAARVLGKPLPVDDAACFDFFRLCTASMTTSVFPGETFWSLQMLQAAHAEPAIWKAAVALGAFHRRWEYSNYCLNPNVTRRPGKQRDNADVALFTDQALKHYAVSLSLAKSITDPNMLAILSVALGAAAHLAGRWTESQVHIRAGMRILRELGSQIRLADLEGAAQALERLDTQAMSLSDATSPYEYTSTALEESRQLLLGDPHPREQSIRQNPNTLLGPMDDLGQAALATFRLMRQFFIIADAVTTGTMRPNEFEQARIQMVEANARCERQLTLLIDIERSKLRYTDKRESKQPDQKVLVLSLRLYQTTLKLLLLAHGVPSDGFPLPTWATDDPDTLSSLNTSAIPNRDIPTPNVAKDTVVQEHFSYSSSPAPSYISTSASEYYNTPQVQPKAPVAPTSPNPTLVPSRSPSPSPYASAAPSPRPSPSPGPCPRPVPVQSRYQTHTSYSMPTSAFIPHKLNIQPGNRIHADPIPNQSPNTVGQSSESNSSPNHKPSNPNTEAEAEEDVEIPTSETRWDALHAHFKLIVLLASEIAKNTDSPLPFFMSLEPGLAMPLYFTVKRCRHPVTRRRALGLLRRLNRQEGVWNCALAARAAEEVVILEEEGLLSSLSGAGSDVERDGNDICDIETDFGRLGTNEGRFDGHHGQHGQSRSRSRSQSEGRDKGDEELLLPLDIFEKGEDGDGTCEMSRLLEQYRLKVIDTIRTQRGARHAPGHKESRQEAERGSMGKEEVDEDIVMSGEVDDTEEFGQGLTMDERNADDGPEDIPFWEDGWPNIPEDKRILVQYPIFKMEENQLELLMFVMGDMKDGEEQGRMARRVVVDLF